MFRGCRMPNLFGTFNLVPDEVPHVLTNPDYRIVRFGVVPCRMENRRGHNSTSFLSFCPDTNACPEWVVAFRCPLDPKGITFSTVVFPRQDLVLCFDTFCYSTDSRSPRC